MIDQNVRDFLERMATEEPTPFLDVAPLTRRARRRAARTAAIGALSVAAAIAVLIGGVSQLYEAPPDVPAIPAPPIVSASPGPFPERFDSPLNGLSIGYPYGWKTRAATEPWSGGIAFDAPDADVIFDPRFLGDLYLAIVSEPIGSTSPRDWVNDHTDQRSMGVCYAGGAGGIGGGFQVRPSWFQECYDARTGRTDGHIAIFATPTRGYVIYVHVADKRLLQTIYDGDWFFGDPDGGGILATVELRSVPPA